MAKIPSVGIEVWKLLYASAQEYFNLKPWQLMLDSDLFGVRSGETGYACVLGNAGQVFGLCVYRGAEGLHMYLKLQGGRGQPKPDDLWGRQNCLVADFADRDELQEEDRRVIKTLGLSFRGAKSWPMFRSHLPGHFPWHLEEEEAKFLTLALDCSCAVFNELREGRLDLHGRPSLIPVLVLRVPRPDNASPFAVVWEPPPEWKPAPPEPYRLDVERLKHIRGSTLKADSSWQVDVFYAPGSIMDRDRPYLPCCVIVAHELSGFVFHVEVCPFETTKHQAAGNAVLQSIEQHGLKPSEIQVRDPALIELLQPLASALDIGLRKSGRLGAVNSARRFMEKRMSERG